jgi:cell division protein FtsN
LKKYPSGEFTAQAQARVKELYEERDWQKARDADTPEAYQAFLKQYPEGKWTEEARIRVENFTLAQAPGAGGPAASPGNPAPSSADSAAAASKPPPGETPQPAPSVAATPPPKAVSKSTGAESGTYGIQLGAFKTGAKAADEHWHRLQKEYPKALAGLSSKVSPKKTAEGTLYRLQAVGLTEKRARDLCSTLKAKSQACVVVPPPA